MLGPIREARGAAGNQACYPAEDIVAGQLTFASGVLGTGLWCSPPTPSIRTEIVGDRGLISFSVFGTDPVRLAREGGVTESPSKAPAHVQQPLVQLVVDDLLDGTRAVPAPARPPPAPAGSWISRWYSSGGIPRRDAT